MFRGSVDHCGVLLKIKWGENSREHQVERIVHLYQKTNVTGLQIFFRGKFAQWASNGCCVKGFWKRFNELVFESIDCFVPRKILRKILILITTRK
jgi:hypothetical protein